MLASLMLANATVSETIYARSLRDLRTFRQTAFILIRGWEETSGAPSYSPSVGRKGGVREMRFPMLFRAWRPRFRVLLLDANLGAQQSSGQTV
jgi:hypothetical protein